jgi:hypothetical protein
LAITLEVKEMTQFCENQSSVTPDSASGARWPGVLLALGAVAPAAFLLVARPWYLRWGATNDEVVKALPGDDLVPNAVLQSTRAVTIEAPPEVVWPWIAQLGQGRGGFYSHTFIQNLIKSDIHNANRVIPELQDVRIGDTIWLASPQNLGTDVPHFRVAHVEPGRTLVLGTPSDADERLKVTASWSFVVEPIRHGMTRLIIRYRSFSQPAWVASAFSLEPIAFVMERRMLLGIKKLAENSWAREHGEIRSETLLDEVLPVYDFRGVETTTINASPVQIFGALRAVTLGDMPLAYALGTLRYLPGLLSGRKQRQQDELSRPFFEVADMRVLAETPDQEVVIGSIGKLHDMLDQQFVKVPDLETFKRFDQPDYEKFVQSIRIVGEDESAGCRIVAEHRTQALSPSARRKFAIYWYLLVGWGGNFLLRLLLRAVKRRAEILAEIDRSMVRDRTMGI